MKITSYKDKNGKTRYKFNAYLGIDPMTGKEMRTNRQGFKTEREAIKAYLRVTSGDNPRDKRITFEEVYQSWLSQYKLGVKHTTLRKVEGYFERIILPYFGEYDIHKIKLVHCQNFINDNYLKYKDNRFLKYRLSNIFKHAMKLGYIKTNPAELAEVPKTDEVDTDTHENFWDKPTLLEFLAHAKNDLPFKWYVMFHLMAFTGLRRGEVLALTWGDIDFTNARLSVNKNLTGSKEISTPKTKSSVRTIEIDSVTLGLLKDWRAMQGTGFDNPIVFTDTRGDYITLSTPIKHLNKIVKAHDLPHITLHGFRHTHCSLLFEAGASIKEVQDRLGHGNVKTTMDIYAHVTKNRKREVADRFSDFMYG